MRQRSSWSAGAGMADLEGVAEVAVDTLPDRLRHRIRRPKYRIGPLDFVDSPRRSQIIRNHGLIDHHAL